MISPANGSFLASSPGAPSTTVISSTPSPCSQVTDSQATTPPPTTTIRRGISCRLVTSREVHGRASASPGTGGIAAELPVSSTTACRAVSTRSVPSGPVTVTSRSPDSRP